MTSKQIKFIFYINMIYYSLYGSTCQRVYFYHFYHVWNRNHCNHILKIYIFYVECLNVNWNKLPYKKVWQNERVCCMAEL